jgi:hypothetical protein
MMLGWWRVMGHGHFWSYWHFCLDVSCEITRQKERDPMIHQVGVKFWLHWNAWHIQQVHVAKSKPLQLHHGCHCLISFSTQLSLTTSGKGNLQMIKKNSAFSTKFFANFHYFCVLSRAHAGTLQNPSICPCATTLRNNSVESSSIFYSNLMLCINWFY